MSQATCKPPLQEYGWSDTLFYDNGPGYTAIDFRQLMDNMGLYRITSSPYYHQSNGPTEMYTQHVKSLSYKAKKSGEDPYFASVLYRNTALSQDMTSSME